ncbi:hypothetical protein NDU88_003089 [Pleurodeles waltl]|uniref:Reverse transcriptase domain-containing protein n=1 Tax=Pleurodeles waltl TaxID=8319 RepID=A0AAV7W6D8_PLEWA|nr:hypothetical protein NDU88_003089 [Pleurodeles waltl]
MARNMRRLLETLEGVGDEETTSVIFPIDMEKAFNSLERTFLYSLMEHFGLGQGFISSTKLLSIDPTAGLKQGI